MIETLKKNIRNSLKLIGLAALISAVSLWFFSTDYPTMIKNRYLTGSIENYMNVSIGDKREDILYKLGAPDYVVQSIGRCKDGSNGCFEKYPTSSFVESEKNKNIKNYGIYVFENPSNYRGTLILVIKNNKVDRIICQDICSSILGINLGDSEKHIKKIIGNPSISEIDSIKGSKTLIYEKLNLRLSFIKLRLVEIDIG